MANEIEHEGEAVTSQWLLSNLTTALQHHLEYACKAKKYGTILYRPNADLILLLQQSLSKLHQHEKTQPTAAKSRSSMQKNKCSKCLERFKS